MCIIYCTHGRMRTYVQGQPFLEFLGSIHQSDQNSSIPSLNMKTLAFILLLALVAMTSAAPGGYTLNGGVFFDPDRHLDYMEQARHAGKFAWDRKIAEEEVQGSVNVDRGERNAQQYVPTFFTQPTNHKILTQARPQVQSHQLQTIRAQRETPVYNNAIYRSRR